MKSTPYPFLKLSSFVSCDVTCISSVQVFEDEFSQLIMVCGDFSVDTYLLSDYRSLGIDLPTNISNSVVKRQTEYLCGRYLSRLALRQSGLFFPTAPQISTGPLRAPVWPDSVTGSITHHNYRAWAVLLTQPLASNNFIGIDTELWLSPMQAKEIAATIHNEEELLVLLSAGFNAAQATTLLFSAKEALFKAICPFVGEYFGFEVVQVELCSELQEDVSGFVGSMQLRLIDLEIASKAPQDNYACWFSCSEQEVLTLVCSQSLEKSFINRDNG